MDSMYFGFSIAKERNGYGLYDYSVKKILKDFLNVKQKYSSYLWICVMTHSLINVCSQVTIGGNQGVSYVCKVSIIVIAVVLSVRAQNKRAVI